MTSPDYTISYKNIFLAKTGPVVKLSIILMGICFLGRCLMAIMYYKRIVNLTTLATVLAGGLITDIITTLIITFPVLLVTFITKKPEAKTDKIVNLTSVYALFAILTSAFLEIIGLTYSIIFQCRPNRIFFEYLIFPKEVFSTVTTGFPISSFIIVISMITLPLVLYPKVKRMFIPPKGLYLITSVITLASYLGIFIILVIPVLNDWTRLFSYTAVTNDRVLNNIAMNSVSSSFCGINTMIDRELDGSKFFGKLANKEVLYRISQYSSTPLKSIETTEKLGKPLRKSAAVAKGPMDFIKSVKTDNKTSYKTAKTKNLVIIVEESLSASYCGHLGGANLTPNLDKLASQGFSCSKMYSNGDRTVRALEALVCGILPTAGRGITKQPLIPQHLFSIGRLLKDKGYITEFIYGGDRNFDYMWRFFSQIGFDFVYDENNNTQKDVFHAPWGICDGDLFDRSLQVFDSHNGKPFFSLILTTSLHDPFTFPDGIIEPKGKKASYSNAARYADQVLGDFFRKARKTTWYDDTIFLVVADHNLRVGGSGLLPIDAFHIPAVFIGKNIKAENYSKICHQIDLLPTALHLIGMTEEIKRINTTGFNLLSTNNNIWERQIGKALDEQKAKVLNEQKVKVLNEQTDRAFLVSGYTAALITPQTRTIITAGKPPLTYIKVNEKFIPDYSTKSQSKYKKLETDCLAFALSTNVLFYQK